MIEFCAGVFDASYITLSGCFIANSLRGMAHAQISTATLVGTVKDPTGAVVAGAKVEAKNIATGGVRSTTTDGRGEYALPNLCAEVPVLDMGRKGTAAGPGGGIVVHIILNRARQQAV